jgi:hypothetical protein
VKEKSEFRMTNDETSPATGRVHGFLRALNSSFAIRHSSFNPDAPYALCGTPKNGQGGFTLLEVMVAMFVFFIVVFAILGMVVQAVGSARALQRQQADCGMVASMTSLSNVLEEGVDEGDFEGLVPDYRWVREVTEVGSNGLFQVDITVVKKNAAGKEVGETMSMLKFTGQQSKGPGGLRR